MAEAWQASNDEVFAQALRNFNWQGVDAAGAKALAQKFQPNADPTYTQWVSKIDYWRAWERAIEAHSPEVFEAWQETQNTLREQTGMASSPHPKTGVTIYSPRFKVVADTQNSEVQDLCTGLIWRRYAEGQTWDEVKQSSTGQITRMKFEAAQKYVQAQATTDKPWRLPGKGELVGLVEDARVNSDADLATIDHAAFPLFSATIFWTSSKYERRDKSESPLVHYVIDSARICLKYSYQSPC